jgi:Fe-S-cluster containining protein
MSDDTLSPEDLFKCRQCGDCCRGYGGTFLADGEIDVIARFLDLDIDKFISDFCQVSGQRPMIAQGKNGYCVFWDGLCTIHPVKPQMCKKWPFIGSVLVDVGNWHIMADFCPGIETDASDQQVLDCVKKVLANPAKPEN